MTTHHNFNNPPLRPRILVAPLEWGLGHATRCIPIIYELLKYGCEVLLAAEGATGALLKDEFPDLIFLPLMGYRMKYSRKKKHLPVALLVQVPKIILTIYKEHAWLKMAVKKYKIDAVISDNRFGLYHKTIPSIYITHQLLIKTNNPFTEKVIQRIHYLFINKYLQGWIPDAEKDGIAGELSHPEKLPLRTKYIGPLSRFDNPVLIEKKYDLLVAISGPEPQRTIFEDILLKDLEAYSGKVLFVRGLPGKVDIPATNNHNLQIENHLSASQLNLALRQSDFVITRSGYTSIMDLLKLGKRAVLVPTPAQTEQEYLGKYLMERKIFYSVSQEDFILKDVLERVGSFPFVLLKIDMEGYKDVVREFAAWLGEEGVGHEEHGVTEKK